MDGHMMEGHMMGGQMMHMADAPDDVADGMGADAPCAFTALSMGALDTVLVFLVAALAYVFVVALRPVALRPDLPRLRLLPPLRGPPLRV
jgi:hypothetical protein